MTKYCAFRDLKTGEIVYVNPDLVRVVQIGSDEGTVKLIFGANHEVAINGSIEDVMNVLKYN